MSEPMLLPVVSVPLNWKGTVHAPRNAPADEGRVPGVPDGVGPVAEGGGGAVVDPDQLLVRRGLGARRGPVEGPGDAGIGRTIGSHPERPAGRLQELDADRRRPGGAVRCPVHRWIALVRVGAGQRQARLCPGRPGVGRVHLGLVAGGRVVVAGRDDAARVGVEDPDVGLGAVEGSRRPGDPLLRRPRDRELGGGDRGLVLDGLQVLVVDEPLAGLLEHQGVAPAGIVFEIARLGVGLLPYHPQPERDVEAVPLLFLGAQHARVLVCPDCLLERAAADDVVARDLLFERRPLPLGSGFQPPSRDQQYEGGKRRKE